MAKRFYIAILFRWRGANAVSCLFQRYSDDRDFLVNTHDVLYGGVLTSNFHRTNLRVDAHHKTLLRLLSHGVVTMENNEIVALGLGVNAKDTLFHEELKGSRQQALAALPEKERTPRE